MTDWEKVVAECKAQGITLECPDPRYTLAAMGVRPEQMLAALRHPTKREAMLGWLMERQEQINLASHQHPANDFLHHGYRPQFWHDVRRVMTVGLEVEDNAGVRRVVGPWPELVALGGNRGSKSTMAATLAVELATAGDRFDVLMLHTSESMSIDLQQPYVFAALPPHLRMVKRQGQRTKISYTQPSGFTDNKLVLPNGSLIKFGNYMQYVKDPKVFEGGQFNLIVLDEQEPPGLLETLRSRTSSTGPLLILRVFTPIEGGTPSIKEAMTGAKLVKSFPVDYLMSPRSDFSQCLLSREEVHYAGCPRGHMPYLMQCARRDMGILFFWTQWNPFQPWPDIVRLSEGLPRETIRMRRYGLPERVMGSQFPRFNADIHGMPWEAMAAELHSA